MSKRRVIRCKCYTQSSETFVEFKNDGSQSNSLVSLFLAKAVEGRSWIVTLGMGNAEGTLNWSAETSSVRNVPLDLASLSFVFYSKQLLVSKPECTINYLELLFDASRVKFVLAEGWRAKLI